MASLYKRGSVWWGRVAVANREHRRSLRTGHRPTAKERLDAWQAELQNEAHFGIVTRSWDEALLAFVSEPPADLAPSTLARYTVSFRAVHGVLSGQKLAKIDRKILHKIARRPGVSNATRRRDLTAVSAVLAYACQQDWIAHNPARDYDRSIIKERKDPIVLPPDDEVVAFIAACHASTGRGGRGTLGYLARILELTGMRLEECADLTWPEIDLARGAIQLARTKGRRARAISLSAQAAGTVAVIPRALKCPLVFWHSEGRRYKNLSSRLAAMKRRLAFGWRAHDLRHLYAVRYLRSGGSIYLLQQQLGHRSIATTERYLAFLTPEEQVVAKRLTGTDA